MIVNRHSADVTMDNLLWLRANFPDVYHRVRNREADEKQVRTAWAKNGSANLEWHYKGDWQAMYSRYNPEKEAALWAQQLSLTDQEDVILIGMGLGYHIEALIHRYPSVRVHLFETDEHIFLESLKNGVFWRLSKDRIASLEVHTSGSSDLGTATTRFLSPILSRILERKVSLFFAPFYERFFPHGMETVARVNQRMVQQERGSLWVNARFQRLWTINALKNLPYTVATPSVDVLADKVKNRPMVIVSSGPSLDREIENLKRVRDRVFILAAGSSVNGLVKQGVLPHAMISYDPHPNNQKVFQLLKEHGQQIPLIFGTTIYHKIIEDYSKQHLLHAVISQDTVTPYLSKMSVQETKAEPAFMDAPSIAIVAVQVAFYLEANPIVLVGQDLAFPGKRFYASGVSHMRGEELTEEEMKQYFEVEQVGGGQVLTSQSLHRMRENLEGMLRQMKALRPEVQVVNTSVAGARIQDTVEKTFLQFANDYLADQQPLDYDAWLRHCTQSTKTSGHLTAQLDALWLRQDEVEHLVASIVEWMEESKSEQRGERLEQGFRRLDQMMRELRNHPLFQVIYTPLMRTQLNMYDRLAAQVRQEKPTVEKNQRILYRLYELLSDFYKARELLISQRLLNSAESMGKSDG